MLEVKETQVLCQAHKDHQDQLERVVQLQDRKAQVDHKAQQVQ